MLSNYKQEGRGQFAFTDTEKDQRQRRDSKDSFRKDTFRGGEL